MPMENINLALLQKSKLCLDAQNQRVWLWLWADENEQEKPVIAAPSVWESEANDKICFCGDVTFECFKHALDAFQSILIGDEPNDICSVTWRFRLLLEIPPKATDHK